MKNWKLVAYNEVTKEIKEVACFKSENLNTAEQHVIDQLPQYYYGCNIVELNSEGEEFRNCDFLCVPVKEYFQKFNHELPVPA